MKLLVGIPTHRRPDLLRECLESIARQQGELPGIEVFVADNHAAGQEGVCVAKEIGASYRFPLSAAVVEEPGISAVRNAILGEARRRGSDFIAMIDDDETASTEWLVNLLKMQRATSADVVGGPVHFSFASPPNQAVIQCWAFRPEVRSGGRTSPLRGTGNFLVATGALAKAGWPLFDHDFGLTGGGDSEWFLRLSHVGLGFAWAPDAVASEKVPSERTTEQWILQRAYRCGNANMRIAMKHWPSREMITNLGKMALIGGSAPILIPLLLMQKRRLWLLRAWSTAAGGAAAISGRDFHEYAVRHAVPGGGTKS